MQPELSSPAHFILKGGGGTLSVTDKDEGNPCV